MRRFVLLIALFFSLTTVIPISLAEELQVNNEKSEVKLNTAIKEPEKITYDEKITVGDKATGEGASFWFELINNVINKVEDIVDSVKDWYENSSFATKVILAAIVAFIGTIILVGVAVVAGLIAGVSALALTIVGLVAALVAAAYSIFTGEENFSLLESVLVGITGGLTAAFLAFTAIGAAIVAAVQSGLGTAWAILSRRVLPAVGRFILTQSKALWGLLTQRVIPAIGRFMTQRVWPFVTTRIWNPLRTFFTSTLFRANFTSGWWGGIFGVVGKALLIAVFEGRFIFVTEVVDAFTSGFLTTFFGALSVRYLALKGIVRGGGLEYLLAVYTVQFPIDILDKFIHGELANYALSDFITVTLVSLIGAEVGLKLDGSMSEILSGTIGEGLKFLNESFKKRNIISFSVLKTKMTDLFNESRNSKVDMSDLNFDFQIDTSNVVDDVYGTKSNSILDKE